MAQKLDDLRLAGLELDPRLEAQDPVPAGPLRDQGQDSVPARPIREQKTQEQVEKTEPYCKRDMRDRPGW